MSGMIMHQDILKARRDLEWLKLILQVCDKTGATYPSTPQGVQNLADVAAAARNVSRAIETLRGSDSAALIKEVING